MSARLSFLGAAALSLGAASACRQGPDYLPNGQECVAHFQDRAEPARDGDRWTERDFTVTANQNLPPVDAYAEGTRQKIGFAIAMDVASTRGAGEDVPYGALLYEGRLTGAAFPGSDVLTVDPTEAVDVSLSQNNPNPYDAEENPTGWKDTEQALYATVDMTSGQPSNLWRDDEGGEMTLSLFKDCQWVVVDVNGYMGTTVQVSTAGTTY